MPRTNRFLKPLSFFLAFALIVGLAFAFYNFKMKTPLALPEFSEVSSIKLEPVDEGVGLGEIALTQPEEIETVLDSLQNARKTSQKSLNDAPLAKNYLKVYIEGPQLQRLYVYQQGSDYLVEEAYVGIYKAKASVFAAIEKVYLDNGGWNLQGNRQALWNARTNYVGDNSAVAQILNNLKLPDGIVYDGFELETAEHPYTIRMKCKVEELTSEEFPNKAHETLLTKNAIIMFSLIENLELVYFEFDDAYRERDFQLADGIASSHLGEDYFELTETYQGFNLVLKLINELTS